MFEHLAFIHGAASSLYAVMSHEEQISSKRRAVRHIVWLLTSGRVVTPPHPRRDLPATGLQYSYTVPQLVSRLKSRRQE